MNFTRSVKRIPAKAYSWYCLSMVLRPSEWWLEVYGHHESLRSWKLSTEKQSNDSWSWSALDISNKIIVFMVCNVAVSSNQAKKYFWRQIRSYFWKILGLASSCFLDMENSVHLGEPIVFIQVGIRFFRDDGSTSDCLPGNVLVLSSKGQTTSMVVQDRKFTVIVAFLFGKL